MKTKNTIILTVLFILPGVLLAGRKEGVMNEFRALEDALRSKTISDTHKISTLEQNLVRGVKLAVTRRFYNERKELLKDINAQAITYESPTSELIYYVKYKNFVIRFDFVKNPELFDQAPIYEKFLIKDENAAPAKSAEPAKPAESGPGGK
jgi:hypothetical protein